MGKIRRERQKYHLTRATKIQSSPCNVPESGPGDSSLGDALASLPVALPRLGVFDNVVIDTGAIVQKLPEFDRCSVRSALSKTSASQQGPKLTKKQKQKLRHATFIEKINAIQNARKIEKDAKKRRSTVITGDMRPLTDALPSLDAKEANKCLVEAATVKPVKKFKARRNEMLRDIEAFRQVLNHPSFQSDPQTTIMEHLRNKLHQELQ